MTEPKNVLFVCVENAGRSQMAEAFFKKYAKNQFNVISAGTSPLFVKDIDDWNIEDPKGKSIEDVRKIRDQIKNDVLNLLNSIESDA